MKINLKTHKIIFMNGKKVVLPIKRPRSYRTGSLRFGYTVEGEGANRKFIPNMKQVYRCYHAKLTEEVGVLSGCGFKGSFEEVKEHESGCDCE